MAKPEPGKSGSRDVLLRITIPALAMMYGTTVGFGGGAVFILAFAILFLFGAVVLFHQRPSRS